MSSGELKIARRAEDRLDPTMRSAIAELLEHSFPNVFGGRTYSKQLSSFRYLAHLGPLLVGHVGLIDRVVRLGESPVRIFGIVDLCVQQQHRRRGIGGELAETAVEAAREAGVDFVLLFADDPELYRRLGFRRASNMCTWLAIHEHKSLGVKTASLADCLMVMAVGSKDWVEDAPLDLLGHVF